MKGRTMSSRSSRDQELESKAEQSRHDASATERRRELEAELRRPSSIGNAKRLAEGGVPGLPEWAWHL